MGCLHGRRATVGGVFALVACMVDVPMEVMRQLGLCRQRANPSVGKVDGVLTWFVWLAY